MQNKARLAARTGFCLAFSVIVCAQPSGRPDYILGAGDLILVRALHVPEMPDKPIPIAADGTVDLPMTGRVKAAGGTAADLGRKLETLLARDIRDPHVSVELAEARSHPVSVLGAVKNPGVYQAQGQKHLLEILSAAGGPDADAGDTVRVSRPLSRGIIPLEGAREIEGASVVEVSLPDLLEAKHPKDNLLLEPDDVVTVPRAKLVYVVGEVKKSGGFVLHDRASMPVLQAISLAEGLTAVAGAAHAKIVRQGAGADRQEIPVNIKDLLAGKTADPMLQAGDILFVPDSQAKSAGLRAVEAAIQMGTGVVIWRH
ncbi:MAG TPA: polysaccharide biosynthesis/export family protein [Bryobacteraceae bacterium]|jgi:polysaccharide export outer membrane protein|nr:polysaccharide biosynthesis/export family protein [Bryobacteraceae bacterium]